MVLSEIKGRLMEDIVLLETKLAANSKKKVFKKQFSVGEFDMVVRDPNAITCEMYKFKHRKEAVKS